MQQNYYCAVIPRRGNSGRPGRRCSLNLVTVFRFSGSIIINALSRPKNWVRIRTQGTDRISSRWPLLPGSLISLRRGAKLAKTTADGFTD
ncbi:hypothetical protein TNCT_288891 [Trichonephila clavata]|uniref:Uncharacterized protein n=1 Tax=Trichonephila clavata TaxID=2740835 RepID=A0A8X6HVT6_TRICU|nr:hypothetical protein TNCT_288891 [Trichonephila clavata]